MKTWHKCRSARPGGSGALANGASEADKGCTRLQLQRLAAAATRSAGRVRRADRG